MVFDIKREMAGDTGANLSSTLQYSGGFGDVDLCRFFKEHIKVYHHVVADSRWFIHHLTKIGISPYRWEIPLRLKPACEIYWPAATL
jgi:hypothetical protein